jgi:hypothetical protein
VYDVMPYGRVFATTGGEAATADILADVSTEQRASQALKLMRDADDKFQGRNGIVLIDVRRRADLTDVAELAARRAVLAKCRMIVVADSVADAVQQHREVRIVRAVSARVDRGLTNALAKFATVVAGRHGLRATPVDGTFHAGHQRLGATRVRLVEHYRQPDGTFKVSAADLAARRRAR